MDAVRTAPPPWAWKETLACSSYKELRRTKKGRFLFYGFSTSTDVYVHASVLLYILHFGVKTAVTAKGATKVDI